MTTTSHLRHRELAFDTNRKNAFDNDLAFDDRKP